MQPRPHIFPISYVRWCSSKAQELRIMESSAKSELRIPETTSVVPLGNQPKYYSCSLCDKKYTCPRALGGHQTCHRGEHKLMRKDLRLRHGAVSGRPLLRGGEPEEKPIKYYQCSHCEKRFTCSKALGGHQTCHREAKKFKIALDEGHQGQRMEQATAMELGREQREELDQEELDLTLKL